MPDTRLSIRLDLTSGDRIGPGKIALLEAIQATGSISAAARSLGMSYGLAMRRIILPQALRRVLAPITNESITLLKNTSLVSTIALADLLRAGLEVMSSKANTFSPFAGVALCYLALTLPLLALNNFLERRYRVT